MSYEDQELLLRVQRMKIIVEESSAILNAEKPKKPDVLRYVNKLANVITPIEKARPNAKASAAQKEWYLENAANALLDANDRLVDMKTILEILTEEEKKEEKTPAKSTEKSSGSLPKHLDIKLATFCGAAG